MISAKLTQGRMREVPYNGMHDRVHAAHMAPHGPCRAFASLGSARQTSPYADIRPLRTRAVLWNYTVLAIVRMRKTSAKMHLVLSSWFLWQIRSRHGLAPSLH